jgi:drug/metabolite transporter (DMT)-like permease
MVKRTSRTLIRDLVTYVAIGLLLLAIVAALAIHAANKGEPLDSFTLNWLCFGGVMAIVYVTATYQHRSFWKSRRFWAGIAAASFLEIGVGILALRNAPRLGTWFWGLVIYPVNTVAVNEFLNRWLPRSSPGEAA